MDRWRGRRLAGLALAAILAVSAGGATVAARDAPSWLVVRDAAGVELSRVALPEDGAFALRYRNSLYESSAEEWFRVDGERLILERLAADELAVLEEYYSAFGAVDAGTDGDARWTVAVERPPIALPHSLRATALGRRTLIVGDTEIELWRLVAGRDETLVVLSVEGTR